MHRVTAIFFTLIIFLSLLDTGHAAAKKLPAKLQVDTSTIVVKHFNANALNKFRTDKDFNYNDNTNAGQPSLWDRFWEWVWSLFTRLFKAVPYSGPILKYLLMGLAIALLVYIIAKSFGIDPVKLWRGESKKINIPYSESLENIHEINFDNEVEKAISQNNYRLAVRLLYLRCLKQLSDLHLIQWQIDKTNSAYINELADTEQKQTFKLITRQFEYVWYGNFAIDKQAYSNIDVLFQHFKKQLP